MIPRLRNDMRAAGTAMRPTLIAMMILVTAAAGCRIDAPVDPDRLELDFATPGMELPDRPVILFFVDGLHEDVLREMAAAGELPRIKRFLLDRAASVRTAVCGLPSITFANSATIITGCVPGRHGVHGNKWFDRDRLLYRDYQTLATVARVNNDIEVPTIYELLDDRPTADVFLQVNRGVKIPVDVYPLEGGLQTGAAYGIGLTYLTDRLIAKRIREVGRYARMAGRWPDFTLIYFPGPDHVAHLHGHRSPEYRAALINLEECIGGTLEALHAAGVLDRFLIGLTADHGHVECPAVNSMLLETELPLRCGLPVVPAGPDEITPYPRRARDLRDPAVQNVLVREGDRVAHLHFRVADAWSVRPTAQQSLQRLAGPDGKGIDRLIGQDGIDLIAVRDGADAVRVRTKLGTGTIRRERGATPQEDRFAFMVEDDPVGNDPLGYQAFPAARALCDGRAHTAAEWLAATAETEYPDLVPQLPWMFAHRRAGDVCLFAAPGWDFSPENVGGHGGVRRGEMRVPFHLAGPGVKPGRMIPAARLADWVPTLLELTGGSHRLQGKVIDGVSRARELAGE